MRTVSPAHGIVLAGSYSWAELPLERLAPRPLLPIAQAPLVLYALRWLELAGLPSASVCVNSGTRNVRQLLAADIDLALEVRVSEDAVPRGAAGCMRDAGLTTAADTFLVVDGTTIPTLDVECLLAAHRGSGALLTVVTRDERAPRPGGQALDEPAGVYVVEREVFEQIPEHGFLDLKEGLIPKLYRQGSRVQAYRTRSACPRVLNAESYRAANHWMVQRLVADAATPPGYVRNGQALLHESARVAADAVLVGPIVVGPGASIRGGAAVVGPALLGWGSQLGEGAVLSRSVTWSRAVVGPGAIVDRSVLTDGMQVRAAERLLCCVGVPERIRQQERRASDPLLDTLADGRHAARTIRASARPAAERPPLHEATLLMPRLRHVPSGVGAVRSAPAWFGPLEARSQEAQTSGH